MTSELEIPRGSVEFVGATVTEVNGLDLNQATIKMAVTASGSTHTWLTAQWDGAQWTDDDGTHRKVRTSAPVTFAADAATGSYTIYVQPTDSPETPIVRAGVIKLV